MKKVGLKSSKRPADTVPFQQGP